MANHHLRTLIQHLRQSLRPRGDDMLEDAQLLERWVKQRDEAAFEVLLWRHGPMVLSVCRRLLRDSHDVEDAFQAAFLTLVRKAASIRRPQALAGWLYRVAYRIALRLCSETALRTRREQLESETLASAEGVGPGASELRAVLDEEIDALPERYRQVFVLCCLEGKTHAEVGRLLGRPTGTISCWLKRGRELLGRRLAQRGIAPAAALAVLGESEVRAALPAALVQSTCRAASVFAVGGEGAAVISARVAGLVEVAMRGVAATKLQWTLVLGLMLSMAATGAGMWAYQPSPVQGPPAKQEAEKDASKHSPQQDKQAARTDRFGDPLPEGAVARLGTARQRAFDDEAARGPRAFDAAAAITPDGRTIVTLYPQRGNAMVKFFDASSGKLRGRWASPLQFFRDGVEAYLSPNGRLLAVQDSDSSLGVWDVFTNKQRNQLRLGQGRKIYLAVFSPDGKTLAVGDCEKEGKRAVLRLWDIASGGQRELKGHGEFLGSFVFSADGKFLAAQSVESEQADPYVLCWNVEKGERLWRVLSKDCGTFAFAPDGRTLIAAPDTPQAARESRDSPPWRAWDAATGRPAAGWKFPKERVATNPNYAAANFAIAPDNRTLVFVPLAEQRDREGLDGSVRLWDLRTGGSLHTLALPGRDGWFPAIRIGPFFPDGKSLLTNNDLLRRWELATGRPLWPENEKLGHWADVIGMAYSPDGQRLATASYDNTVRLWDVATAKPLQVIRLRKRHAGYLTFTPDGKHLVSGPECGEVYVWDVETGKEVQHLKLTDPGGIIGDSCHKMRLSTDGRTIIEAGRGSSIADKKKYVGILARWDLASGQRKSRLELEERLRLEDFSPDGQLILVHDEKSDATELLDTTTGMSQVKLEGNPGHVHAFSADGRQIAGIVMKPSTKFPWKLLVSQFTGHTDWDTGDYEIVVWETKTGRALRHISIPVCCEGSLALSPDGCYLADAGMKDLRIWDLPTGKVVLKCKRHEPRTSGYTDFSSTCLAFAPDGRTLATGHHDSTVLIWNAAPPNR